MRGLSTLPILLGLFIACRNGPTQLAAPADNSAFTASAEMVTAVVDLLDDAFVRELMVSHSK